MASLARLSLEDAVRSCALATGFGSEDLCSAVVERMRRGSKHDCCDSQKSGYDRLRRMLDLTGSRCDLDIHSGPAVGRNS